MTEENKTTVIKAVTLTEDQFSALLAVGQRPSIAEPHFNERDALRSVAMDVLQAVSRSWWRPNGVEAKELDAFLAEIKSLALKYI